MAERTGEDNVETAAGSGAASPKLAGRYELLGLLGTGGMGAVYRVRDIELGEVVALKMLRRELVGNAAILERFRQEVRLARRVTHRNVARTFDIGEHEGEKFLTMELVDGCSLKELLAREGALPIDRVVALADAICAGLTAAHDAGVVHRDLKPENVLIAKDGRVVVTDFGIARAPVDSGESGTSASVIVGTPAYMAPEQIDGGDPIDHRADIYALGVVLYEMLTGARAWKGSSVLNLLTTRITATAPPDPRAVRPTISEGAAAVVARCMAIAPGNRFARADDVARALRDALGSAVADGTADTIVAAPPALEPSVRSAKNVAKPTPASKTLAVLPFRNLGKPDDEYLVDGFTEDLIDTLSMTSGLRVRPRGVVAPYKDRSATPAELGRELGVQVIVEGSMRRTNESAVRLSVRLIGAVDGFQLWARRFEAPLTELLLASDDTARAIADALTTELPAIERAAPADPAAIELYLRGKFEYWRTHHISVKHAIDLFEQAHALAPSEPKILAACGMAYARRIFWGDADPAIATRAKEVAQKAIDIAPELGDAWAALAGVQLSTGDIQGGGATLRAGLAHAPNSAPLQELLGRLLTEVGAMDEAMARLKIALDLDPTLRMARLDLARAYAMEGDWAGVDATLDAAAPGEDFVPRDMVRARLALWRGGPIPFDSPPADSYTALACDVLRTRTLTTAQRALMEERGRTMAGRVRPFFLQRNAELLAFVGDLDAALRSVEEAVQADLIDVSWMDHCPLLAPLRSGERWAALRAPVAERSARVLDAIGKTPTRRAA